MHVAIDARYIQDHFPGIGRYTYDVIDALTALAHDDLFTVLYDPSAHNTRYDLAAWQGRDNVRLVEARAAVLRVGQQVVIPRLLAHHRPDVYHNPYYVVPYAALTPMVAMVHDLIPELYPESLPSPRLSRLFRVLVRLTCRRAQMILTGSVSTAEDLHRLLGVPTERLATTPYGVDASFTRRPAGEVDAVRQRLGLARPYLLYLGINKPHKNLVRMVEAWGTLPAAERGDVQLVLAGHEDPRYPETRQAVARLSLEGSVRILGGVANADVAPLYSGALAFVFPSLYEGFGLPVLEAMACGTPVAAADRSSLPEVVGDAGLLFDPTDIEALRDALRRLLADSVLRRDLAARGRARAASFTWERTARDTLTVYRRVIGLEGGA